MSEITTLTPAVLGGASAGAEADSAAASVDAGSVVNIAAPVVALSASAVNISAAADAVNAVAKAGAEAADEATALAEALGDHGEAVLSALKDVLIFAKVEVDHIWDEAVAIALKLV